MRRTGLKYWQNNIDYGQVGSTVGGTIIQWRDSPTGRLTITNNIFLFWSKKSLFLCNFIIPVLHMNSRLFKGCFQIKKRIPKEILLSCTEIRNCIFFCAILTKYCCDKKNGLIHPVPVQTIPSPFPWKKAPTPFLLVLLALNSSTMPKS
jgi:hypothetical protein